MPTWIYRCFRCGAQSSDPDQFVGSNGPAEFAMPEDIACDDVTDCDANLAMLDDLDTAQPPDVDEMERDSRYLDQFTGPRPGGSRY